MSEKSRFFNSVPEDERRYQAEEFAEYFRQFLSSGVYHQNEVPSLELDSEGIDMQTYVEPGAAYIEGYLYKNTDDLYLQHMSADPVDDRIDRVVIRLDRTPENRFVKAFVKTGQPGETPEPPELTRNEFIYEISLAQVLVGADTSVIPDANITDERFDEDVCGLVSSLISVPTSEFQQEWEDWFEPFSTQGELDFNEWFDGVKDEWEIWFDDIQQQSPVSQEDFESHLLDYAHYPVEQPADFQGSPDDEEVHLSWTNPPDREVKDEEGNVFKIAELEEVEVKRDGEVIYAGTDESYEDTGLTNHQEYEYEIVSITKAGVRSEPITITVTPVPYTMDWEEGVDNFSVQGATAEGEKAELTWDNPDVAGFEGVVIRRSETDYPTDLTEGTQVYDGSGEEYTDEGLDNGTTYYYTIWAYNDQNQYSDEANRKSESAEVLEGDMIGGHGSNVAAASNEYARYGGTLEANDGTKTEENIETHFYKITGGSEGAPESGYEDFNGANLLHYFGIASDDTWTGQNSTEPWVKYEWQRKYGSQFTSEPKTCFMPKKSIAYGGNWIDLYLAGVVYGDDLEAGEEGAEHHNRVASEHEGWTEGEEVPATRQDKWIEIDWIGYRIRLLEGGEENTHVGTGDGDGAEHYGENEWNTILYSLVDCSGNGHLGGHYANDESKTAADYKWEEWTNEEANVGTGDGHGPWCQETEVDNDDYLRVYRGFGRVSHFYSTASAFTGSTHGFRPVLQLMD